MDTSKFIGALYIGKVTPEDCVDWANECLESGKDGKYLKKLAELDKSSLENDKVFRLVRYALSDIGFRCHPNEINSKIREAKEIANKILAKEIEPFDGVSKIASIASQIDFPHFKDMKDWIYLEEGTHPECLEKGWIFYKTNQEKWLEVVLRESRKLVFNNLEVEIDELELE